MRKNGTIQYETTTPGGLNDWGEPIAATTAWSAPIGCSIHANTDNRKGRYEDGKFRQASYVVLIENNPLPENIKRITIKRRAEDLGEHDILCIEPLSTVGRIQILV